MANRRAAHPLNQAPCVDGSPATLDGWRRLAAACVSDACLALQGDDQLDAFFSLSWLWSEDAALYGAALDLDLVRLASQTVRLPKRRAENLRNWREYGGDFRFVVKGRKSTERRSARGV